MTIEGKSNSESGPESRLMQDDETDEKSTKVRNGHSKYDVDIEYKPPQKVGNRRMFSRGCGGRKVCIAAVALSIFLTLCVAVSILVYYLMQEEHIQVVLPMGIVKGHIVDSPSGSTVEEFLGVPYAQPPVGVLRYADPVSLQAFPQEPYEALKYKQSCMQTRDTTFGDFEGSTMWNAPNKVSEDCLYMNIWVSTKTSKERKAVMVWIYGGGFMSGSNALWVYDGKALSAYGDVIVVTFNYRTGNFGYLSTGDGRIKGNFGMKDQVLALHWIKENIQYFGGDPERITVFGESSGASSAALHMMSPMSQHLFERAIFESGSPDAHWSFMTRDQAKERSDVYLNYVNCTTDETEKLLSCLRSKDATFLLNNEWVDANYMVFPWTPTIDGEFIDASPFELLERGAFEAKDAILGVNKDEGTYWLLYALPGFNKDTQSLHNYTMFEQGVDTIGHDLSASTRSSIKELYRDQEILDTSNLQANRDALDKVSGDRSFTCPTKRLAETFSRRNTHTYLYYLSHRASTEVWPEWMGVIHGAEIQWVFGMPLQKKRGYTDEEIQFSKKIMKYWSNFAKYGNPNDDALDTWPEYQTEQFIEWPNPSSSLLHPIYSLRQQFCDLWDNINIKINKGTYV